MNDMDALVAATVRELSSQEEHVTSLLSEAFTKQHYIAIAQQIKLLKNEIDDDTGQSGNADQALKRFVDNLASMFKSDNPAFDKQRFLSACGF